MSESIEGYPKKCTLCGEKIGTRVDLDFHGLDICTEVPSSLRRLRTALEAAVQALDEGKNFQGEVLEVIAEGRAALAESAKETK